MPLQLYNRRDPIFASRLAVPRKSSSRLWTPPGPLDPPVPQYLLNDTYTDVNATPITSHASDDGKTWTAVTNWAAAGAINGNKLHGNGTGSAMKASVAPVADCDVTCQIYVASAIHGEVVGAGVRIAAAANTLVIGGILCWSGAWSTTIRRYITDGYFEYITGGFGAGQPTLGSTHTLRFQALGSVYTLWIDGIQSCTTTQSEISAPGAIGTVTGASTASTGMLIDSIQVPNPAYIPPPSPPVGKLVRPHHVFTRHGRLR